VPDIVEAAVPGRNGQPQGDGNGDGIPDAQQAGVVSLLCPSGQWLTLDTPTNRTLIFTDTRLARPPAETSLLPRPYAFHQGFVTLSLRGLADGGTGVIQVLLPTNAQPDTVWAYGPEPGNATPHWYEFLYDGTTGAEIQASSLLLHLVDGSRGDADGLANGISNGLTFGLARLLTAPPLLNVARGDQGTVIITWPIAFPNAARTYLESADDLGSSNQWQFVPDVPLQNGGQNMLINSAGSARQFYRFHGQ
jgi:hypothetical protein